MIKKIYRLKENEVKKVLNKWKPFFSYGLVLNYIPNKLTYSRFSLVLWTKSVKSWVERNFFRRRFFDFIAKTYLDLENTSVFNSKNYDFVFVVKKQTKLDKTDKKTIFDFEKDLIFLKSKTN